MRLYTGKALAKALGLTPGEVDTMRKDGVIDYQQGKVYDLERSAAAIIAQYKARAGQTVTADYTNGNAGNDDAYCSSGFAPGFKVA